MWVVKHRCRLLMEAVDLHPGRCPDQAWPRSLVSLALPGVGSSWGGPASATLCCSGSVRKCPLLRACQRLAEPNGDVHHPACLTQLAGTCWLLQTGNCFNVGWLRVKIALCGALCPQLQVPAFLAVWWWACRLCVLVPCNVVTLPCLTNCIAERLKIRTGV